MVQRLVAVTLACLCACRSHDAAPDATRAQPVAAVKPPELEIPGVHLPDGVTPKSYDLQLSLDPDRDDFSGTVAIHVALDRPTDHIWLHADELAITAAHWDEGKLDVTRGGDRMILAKLGKQVAPRDVTLTFEFTGTTHHDEEGLFRQKDGDRWYLYSQGESEYMRRITPCFDEPRWKTPWTISGRRAEGARGREQHADRTSSHGRDHIRANAADSVVPRRGRGRSVRDRRWRHGRGEQGSTAHAHLSPAARNRSVRSRARPASSSRCSRRTPASRCHFQSSTS